MTKIILATLLAISFNAFATEGTATETTTPPAAEGTAPTGDATMAKDAKKKMAAKGQKHGKHGKGKKEEKHEGEAH
jgi:hypothetical protein